MTSETVKDLSVLEKGDRFKVNSMSRSRLTDPGVSGESIEGKEFEVTSNNSHRDLHEDEKSKIPEFILNITDFMRKSFTVKAVDPNGQEFTFLVRDDDEVTVYDHDSNEESSVFDSNIYGNLEEITVLD